VVVMNFEVPIEAKFPAVFPKWRKNEEVGEDRREEDIHLILSADDFGINTGSFLIRNCEWSFRFLEEVTILSLSLSLSLFLSFYWLFRPPP